MNFIRPQIFTESSDILAVFTDANRLYGSENRAISGVDFGLNTLSQKSETKKNYHALIEQLGLQRESIVLANQVHGSHIEIVEKPGVCKNTDGLITKTAGLSLGIQVADCAALLIADDINEVIGAFHAGWRGAAAEIIPKGLEKMKSIGGEPERFKAYISPCISQEMFEVGEEVASQFPDFFVDRTSFPKPHVDLKGFLMHQLIEAGIKMNQIEVSPGCTIQDDRFFSYRRERENAGRMLGLITLKKK